MVKPNHESTLRRKSGGSKIFKKRTFRGNQHIAPICTDKPYSPI